MGKYGLFLFGIEDEIKVKQLQALFEIKDYDYAKELYIEIKTSMANR